MYKHLVHYVQTDTTFQKCEAYWYGNEKNLNIHSTPPTLQIRVAKQCPTQ